MIKKINLLLWISLPFIAHSVFGVKYTFEHKFYPQKEFSIDINEHTLLSELLNTLKINLGLQGRTADLVLSWTEKPERNTMISIDDPMVNGDEKALDFLEQNNLPQGITKLYYLGTKIQFTAHLVRDGEIVKSGEVNIAMPNPWVSYQTVFDKIIEALNITDVNQYEVMAYFDKDGSTQGIALSNNVKIYARTAFYRRDPGSQPFGGRADKNHDVYIILDPPATITKVMFNNTVKEVPLRKSETGVHIVARLKSMFPGSDETMNIIVKGQTIPLGELKTNAKFLQMISEKIGAALESGTEIEIKPRA